MSRRTLVNHRGDDAQFARVDPATALASLFRPLARGKKRAGGLEVNQFFGGIELRWHVWRELDAFDQDVFFAIVGLLCSARIQLTSATGGSIPKNTWFGVL